MMAAPTQRAGSEEEMEPHPEAILRKWQTKSITRDTALITTSNMMDLFGTLHMSIFRQLAHTRLRATGVIGTVYFGRHI